MIYHNGISMNTRGISNELNNNNTSVGYMAEKYGTLQESIIVNKMALFFNIDFKQELIQSRIVFFGHQFNPIANDVLCEPIKYSSLVKRILYFKGWNFKVEDYKFVRLQEFLEKEAGFDFNIIEFQPESHTISLISYQEYDKMVWQEYDQSVYEKMMKTPKRLTCTASLNFGSRTHYNNIGDKIKKLIHNAQIGLGFKPKHLWWLSEIYSDIFGETENCEIKNFYANDNVISSTYKLLTCDFDDELYFGTNFVPYEKTQKRYQFFKKHHDKIKNFRISPISLTCNNVGIIIINNLPLYNRNLKIYETPALHRFEHFLYACNKYDEYETKIRRLILEAV